MTWAKLSDNFHSHPKTLEMGFAATGLYAMGLSYAAAHETDGFLPHKWVRSVVQNQPYRGLIRRLIDANAWLIVTEPPGYLIVDFLDYNPSREQIRQNRERQADRVTRYRERHRNALRTPSIGPDPTRPVLKPNTPLRDDLNLGVELKDLDLPREVSEYARALQDGNRDVENVLIALRRDLPEAAFHAAMESLKERRTRKPALVSEARYFVATLKTMLREGRYAG
jgi:hypothetical protein